ncbi:MAG: pantetheine-phosphate adenylyltransferase [Acidimicrobiia bacterium]|nr:pantetheine-phosphate adenylyltransferase [Acidimicrobiia bacterium]
MAVALYPGSFDPLHNGHVAVIEIAVEVFDEVLVAVGHNPAKPSGLFTAPERVELIEAATDHLDNVRVVSFTGLVTRAAADQGATCLLKGIRSASDLDIEMLQAKMNAATGDDVPTVFIPGIGTSALVSSRYIREIASAGGDVASVVPDVVAKALAERQQS